MIFRAAIYNIFGSLYWWKGSCKRRL